MPYRTILAILYVIFIGSKKRDLSPVKLTLGDWITTKDDLKCLVLPVLAKWCHAMAVIWWTEKPACDSQIWQQWQLSCEAEWVCHVICWDALLSRCCWPWANDCLVTVASRMTGWCWETDVQMWAGPAQKVMQSEVNEDQSTSCFDQSTSCLINPHLDLMWKNKRF